MEIKKEYLENILTEYKNDKASTILRHALAFNPLIDVISSKDRETEANFKFDIDIPTMKVANQRQSGRCWIFAALNVLRESIKNKTGCDEFELSQSYVSFYDKLEKINYELEAIIDLIDTESDDRTLMHVVSNTLGDGGQWDMFVNLVNKYGICPQSAFSDTLQVTQTAPMNQLINFNLKKFSSLIKEYFNEGGIEKVRKEKEILLEKMYKLLLSFYGIPPKEFDFEYKVDGKLIVEHHTPLSFYEKYAKEETNNYVSLINSPTSDKEFNMSYTVKYLGNVIEGKPVKHLNIPMDRMIELILSQLKDNRIVWFGSDVGPYRNRSTYYWDDKQYDYKTPFDMDLSHDKGKALDYHMSQMTHAMCITGVTFKEDKPVRWKIENSWGSENGKAGYYLMSDTWFNQFVYQAVVDKKYLTKEELEAYNSKPIELKPWDPMGSLA